MLNSLLEVINGGVIDSPSTGSGQPVGSTPTNITIDVGVIITVFAILIGSILLALLISFIIIKIRNRTNKNKQQFQYNPPVQNTSQVQYAQPIQSAPQGQNYNTQKRSNGLLKAFVIILIIAAIVGGTVFVGKCALNKATNGGINTDGNPILLTRAATNNDIHLEQSIEASITNLKDSYIIIPNVDIKDLKITFKYYDSSKNLISTYTKEVGNVVKASSYTISVSHTLSETFTTSYYQYFVSGGTVSYFS